VMLLSVPMPLLVRVAVLVNVAPGFSATAQVLIAARKRTRSQSPWFLMVCWPPASATCVVLGPSARKQTYETGEVPETRRRSFHQADSRQQFLAQ
jgi:hypothetical protein